MDFVPISLTFVPRKAKQTSRTKNSRNINLSKLSRFLEKTEDRDHKDRSKLHQSSTNAASSPHREQMLRYKRNLKNRKKSAENKIYQLIYKKRGYKRYSRDKQTGPKSLGNHSLSQIASKLENSKYAKIERRKKLLDHSSLDFLSGNALGLDQRKLSEIFPPDSPQNERVNRCLFYEKEAIIDVIDPISEVYGDHALGGALGDRFKKRSRTALYSSKATNLFHVASFEAHKNSITGLGMTPSGNLITTSLDHYKKVQKLVF